MFLSTLLLLLLIALGFTLRAFIVGVQAFRLAERCFGPPATTLWLLWINMCEPAINGLLIPALIATLYGTATDYPDLLIGLSMLALTILLCISIALLAHCIHWADMLFRTSLSITILPSRDHPQRKADQEHR